MYTIKEETAQKQQNRNQYNHLIIRSQAEIVFREDRVNYNFKIALQVTQNPKI